MNNNNYYIGVGRDKEAVARVYLKEGEGKSQIRTEKKKLIIRKIQTEIRRITQQINLTKENIQKKTEATLEKNKSSWEEKVSELKKQLKQEKKNKWQDLKEYFYMDPFLCENICQPLKLFNKQENYDLVIRVKGSGFRSQADAIRLGIAKALLKIYPEYKTILKSFSLLTRDARRVERKKPGLKKARKRPQFSKR